MRFALILVLALRGCFSAELSGLRCDGDHPCVLPGEICSEGLCTFAAEGEGEGEGEGEVLFVDRFEGAGINPVLWTSATNGPQSSVGVDTVNQRGLLNAGNIVDAFARLTASHEPASATALHARWRAGNVNRDHSLLVGTGAGGFDGSSRPEDGVLVEIRPAESLVRLIEMVGGAETELASLVINPAIGVNVDFDTRLVVDGTSVSAAVWPSTGPEPPPNLAGTLSGVPAPATVRVALHARETFRVSAELGFVELSPVP